ncbi:MAG: hypothetical protein H6R18_2643 [Proteobacteria bacterium]|nr:hypothetical protein [Pseudomonadota bacterium]
MIIIWGKKHVYRKAGFVADFCPICRNIKGFLLRRIGLAGHLYYISVSDGVLIGHERTCTDCKTTFRADASKYAAISKKSASLDDLRQQTFPNLTTMLSERLALENKVRNSRAFLTPAERKALIEEPFALLSPKVEKKFAAINLDKETSFSILGAFLLLTIGSAMVRTIAPNHVEESLLAFLVLGIIFVGWQFAISGRRFMRTKIIPVLAKALHPLRPTEIEITLVLSELRLLKHKIGFKLKPADLMSHLQNLA